MVLHDINPRNGRNYGGAELEVFAKARRWKSYFSARLLPYLGRNVLEVGAGIGATTAVLGAGPGRAWLCLEPDPGLLSRITEKIRRAELPGNIRARAGFVSDLEESLLFDTILYIDVLEHIRDDRGELAQAARRLGRGGRLIVLSPAYPFLASPFDEAIGHYRRYTGRGLASLTPKDCRVLRLSYLDSTGAIASLANRLFLRQGLPTEKEILFWDRTMIPLSKILDPLLGYRLGRSILGV